MSSNSKKRKKSETENQQELDRSSSPLPSSSSTPVISSNSHTLSPISPPPSKILKTNNNSSEEEVISDILVFQCHKCYTIVGDSTSYILADKELRTLTLKAVSSISFSPKQLETSKEGPTLGSTYHVFKCSNCSTILGKIYRTTPRRLDYMRDNFTFDSDVILTYKVGAYQQIATNITFPNSNIPTIQDFQRLESNILKMQQMILLFKEHLTEIESKIINLTEDNKTTKETETEAEAEK